MITRKGEMTKVQIDRDWPHQVALQAERSRGSHYTMIRQFCEGLSICARGHTIRHNNNDMAVFYFAEREHAERFQRRFGGEFLDPASRPKWPGSSKRHIDGAADERLRYGRCANCID
jgi:hypothetical protein